MLKTLLKKQLSEVFRSYFYNEKKNTMRSKGAIAGLFVFFIVVMVGVLGGIFTFLSWKLCGSFAQMGLGWLYFLILGAIAILLGAFGSVFNTYSGLYLAKDNDLLLSLPIPVKTIMAARLANVYLMGTMYASTALIPALVVYWVVTGVTVSKVICGILFFLVVTMIVLLLSCLLGWVVARFSLRFKNKSFVRVLISLLFVGAYYFVYFKANELITDLIVNAGVYGEKIKGAAYGLYLFGRIGEGEWVTAGVFTAVTAALFVLVWVMMERSFLRIATADGNTAKVRYTEKAVKEKSVFRALLGKEFGRFTSSSSYMLNCGLGALLLPAAGIFLLIKGDQICYVLDSVFSETRADSTAVILCTLLCAVSSMNYTAAPSVSLEGKSLWIPQSLPVSAKTVLRAKASMQLILIGIPMILGVICVALVVNTSPAVKVLLCVLPLLFTVFSALCCTMIGVRMPYMTWTNESAPIKQSGAVLIALLGSWVICILFGGGYLFIGYKVGAVIYLLIWGILYAVLSILLLKWLDTKGARAFSEL